MAFQIIAASVLLLFYGCYFIKMLSQRHKGIKTTQIGKGKTGFVKYIEVTMSCAAYAVLAAEVVSIAAGTSALPTPARIAGACAAIVGLAFFVSSVLTMHGSWRAGVPAADKTSLITGGVYTISRNPAFLGFDLIYLGIVLMFFSLPLYLLSLFAALMLHFQIVNVEEEFLLKAFGDEYLNYRKKVCRYIGRKPRAPSS